MRRAAGLVLAMALLVPSGASACGTVTDPAAPISGDDCGPVVIPTQPAAPPFQILPATPPPYQPNHHHRHHHH